MVKEYGVLVSMFMKLFSAHYKIKMYLFDNIVCLAKPYAAKNKFLLFMKQKKYRMFSY